MGITWREQNNDQDWRDQIRRREYLQLNVENLSSLYRCIDGLAITHELELEYREGFWPTNYIKQDFEDAVGKSLKDSDDARIARLQNASRRPKRRLIIVEVFDRNQDVVAQVRKDADGKCAQCEEKAPFLRRYDNTPYLEVHHKVPLAEGGDDTVENAIALCPNCHRKIDFG